MFTGIIEAQAKVRTREAGRLVVDPAPGYSGSDWVIGESVAVNGCCLTVVDFSSGLHFDLSPETLARTALGRLQPGSTVNLERALQASGRFGGHIVQGHVDTTGMLLSVKAAENSKVFRFQVPKEFDRYLIEKGSISIDGISLTVVSPLDGAFDVWVIPHTIQKTNLGHLEPGDSVNIEFDVLAKYVEKLTQKHI